MKSFEYVVKDELGIHARPAGLLTKEAKKFSSKIMLKKEDKEADASKLLAIMAMGVKKDMTVTVTVEGEDEDAAFTAMQEFFNENL